MIGRLAVLHESSFVRNANGRRMKVPATNRSVRQRILLVTRRASNSRDVRPSRVLVTTTTMTAELDLPKRSSTEKGKRAFTWSYVREICIRTNKQQFSKNVFFFTVPNYFSSTEYLTLTQTQGFNRLY